MVSLHLSRFLQSQVSSSMPHLQSAGGNPARVTSLSHVGGGGFDFGTDYCTLPRKPRRQLSVDWPYFLSSHYVLALAWLYTFYALLTWF